MGRAESAPRGARGLTSIDPARRSLLADPTYLKIWLIGLFWGVVRWLELLAFGVYAFDLTGSPFLVAFLVVLRFLPLAAFGVIFGAFADLASPLRLMTGATAAMALASLGFYLIFGYGEPTFAHIAAAAFLSGTFWACDLPFRRKLIGELAAPERLSSAMALDASTSNGTRMLGPLIGGVLYEFVGIDGVFALSAALYAVAAGLGFAIPRSAEPETRAGPGRVARAFAGVGEAARYAVRDGDVFRILMVTVAFNIWGFPYLAMVPVIGKDELGLSPSQIGAVTALEGLFALIGAVVMTRAANPRRFRAIYFGAVCALFATILVMGLAPGFWTLAIGLCLGGFCAAAFAVMQSTLIYMVAPPGMTGRFLGLMTISIGTGVIGFANIGLTADVVGGSQALVVIALESIPAMIAIAWGWSRLRTG